ncbi:hypothetical protein H2201_005797 [Coniosporium apollinis]|uniref:RWD domain-containing protein n=2 Tax=Coniosporium TaxID=2810619 RepID=A0ABQ9NPN0_9PEZI|nr:hypothetical protein H2199_008378 [Cladosporium sp. JES 115]KAJ9663126.1 hypothetical protein H2201_005797 [Coniosporium apollinis]
MVEMEKRKSVVDPVRSAYESPTFDNDVSIRVNEAIGSASISPSGRDVVLASREGLHIIDLDSPYSPPRHLPHRSPWEVADVQWSPFAARDYWIISTSNQKALVWNLELATPRAPIEFILHAHDRAITDINFSAHHPDLLATCAVDSFVHCWDLRIPIRPVMTFADWNAGATQVKWNRQDEHIVASSHDKFLQIWDERKGAYPLKTIEAHATKIYGVDWNRTRATGVLTCGLDKTIKFWDYSREDGLPERVIETPFPVWRARHTPFGWGVLAMPQRENTDLHMYDRRLKEGSKQVKKVEPVYSFGGHKDNVKEFLWRTRGGLEGGVDNRDFQLVSWGKDRELRLHKIDADILRTVGYEKGKEVRRKLNLTRSGAVYRSFHHDHPLRPVSKESGALDDQPRGQLTAGMNKAPIPAPYEYQKASSFKTMSTGMQVRVASKRAMNPITWMEGVKIERGTGTARRPGSRPSLIPAEQGWTYETPESLGDEITGAGIKYKKVTFEKIDVPGRTATVALSGPWGADSKPAFLRINLKFPKVYPRDATPRYTIEKTSSVISDDTLAKVHMEVQSIADYHMTRKRGCLDAIIGYLLGERGLEESISWLGDEIDLADIASSSDEEDGVGADFATVQSQDLEMSGTDVIGTINANANVPLPKACGAVWADNGRLVCFFPPKPEPKPLFSLVSLRGSDRMSRSQRLFEGFGRLNGSSLGGDPMSSINGEENASDLDSSSSSSTSSSEDVINVPGRFQPPAAWRGGMVRFRGTSQNSSTGLGSGLGSKISPVKPKSYISIHDMTDILPSKRALAEEYEIYGDGPSLCEHNAGVARRHGCHELADIWEFCKLILANEVPLEIMPQQHRREQILVLAKRALVRIKRKDSGLDLAFDEAEAVANPKLKGRVKWGHHPFAQSWFIPKLFEHFERLGDVQMLGMLACIFAEPAAKEAVSNAMVRLQQPHLPMSMQAPAFSLDYFPSQEIAWSLFQPKLSVPLRSTPTTSGSSTNAGPTSEKLDKRLDIYGSAGSSNGPWGSDTGPSDPATPHSDGITPPVLSRSSTYRGGGTASFSSSPEHHHVRRSQSNLANAFASLSRPFSITASSSPPAHAKRATDGDVSTSAPTSGITWGANTVYTSTNDAVHVPPGSGHRRSTSRAAPRRGTAIFPSMADLSYDTNPSTPDSDDGIHEQLSDDDGDAPLPPSSSLSNSTNTLDGLGVSIKVTLRNQDRFDDEGCVSAPLLDLGLAERYRGYRQAYANLLGVWGLPIQSAEVRKFDGLPSYWGRVERGWGKEGAAVGERGQSLVLGDAREGTGRAGRECRVCWTRVTGLHLSYPERACDTEFEHE